MNQSLLKSNSKFLKIWLANLFSNFSVIFYEIAVVWYVVATTNSALAAGGISLALLLGGVFGSILIGQKIDQYPTRNLMILLGILRLLILVAFILIIGLNLSNPSVFYLISFIFSGINAAYGVARAKSVPEVVVQASIAEANALEGVSASIVRIASWGLGGIAITMFSLPIALAITIMGLLVALMFLFITPWESKMAQELKSTTTLGVADGLKIIKNHANVKRVITAEILFYLLMGFLWVAFPIRVAEIGDGLLYGLHGVAFGVGYFITSLMLGAKMKKQHQNPKIGRLYLIGFIIYALGNVVLTFTMLPWIFLIGLFISGLGTTYWSTFRMTIFHTTVPTKEIGKVFSVFDSAVTAVQLPGFILGGILVDTLGTGPVMGLVAILQIVPLVLVAAKKSLVTYQERVI